MRRCSSLWKRCRTRLRAPERETHKRESRGATPQVTVFDSNHHQRTQSMSLLARSGKRGGGKGGPQRAENNRIYANPLPLLFITPKSTSILSPHRVLGLLGFNQTRVENPHCQGILDLTTKSVWIVDRKEAMILWHRGFFGKGDLSRSEPSWYSRQVNARKAAGNCGSDRHFCLIA